MIDQTKSIPYRCPMCSLPDENGSAENFYGILRFEGMPVPVCPNHGDEIVELVPSKAAPRTTLVSLMMLGQIGRDAALV